MLPNMTSSKSFRNSILPSSLSILRSNSDSETNSSTRTGAPTSPASHHRKLWHKPSAVDLSNLRDCESPRFQHKSASNGNSGRKLVKKGEQVPSRLASRKSKTWGTRFSSLLPSLTSSSTTDLEATLNRKTMPTYDPPPPPPPSHPAPSPPTALWQHDTEIETSTTSSQSVSNIEPTIRMTGDSDNMNSTQDSLLSSANTSFLDPQVPDLSLGIGNPQIMAPTPPSPEFRRAKPAPVSPPDVEQPKSMLELDPVKVGKLRKENPSSRPRTGSLQDSKDDPLPGQRLQARATSPMPDTRGRRSVSAQIPPSASSPGSNLNVSGSRVASTPPLTALSKPSQKDQSPNRSRVRRSWLPGGGRSRSNSVDVKIQTGAAAWIMSDEGQQAEYNSSFLINGEKVPELWNEGGTVLVFLHPQSSGYGPSFKVPEFTVSSSIVFTQLIQCELEGVIMGQNRARSFGGRDSLSVDDANRLVSPPTSPPVPEYTNEMCLYLPAASPSGNGQLTAPGQGSDVDLERLVAIRNLFAFLTGQPLVGTKAKPTIFRAFLEIASLLQEFGFTSMDGTSFGDAVELSFGFYMDQLGLADCRHSREKTLEAIILGERMRYLDLYNEAFAHAAGKYSAIMDLKLPLWQEVLPKTQQALERAHLDLVNRQHTANVHLESFDFPAVFAGIANSTSITELKHVRFKVWKHSFSRMRNFVHSYYKSTFGNWPPKASSKKNPFAESGLNRLVLKMLYSDMCALYDLLVDRNNVTSRVMDEVPPVESDDAEQLTLSGLRVVMSEFDRSKPPVLPPIPYDRPLLPTPKSILETYDKMSAKHQAKFDKKLKSHELSLILNKAYNYDISGIKLPFLDQFKDFEAREARGKNTQDMCDQRLGYWLFLYVVIQSLPMLVVDAPGMTHTEGVEYFLCEPPMGNPPWLDDRQVKKMWYEVAGGGGLVELSTDTVLFSVEATYLRSHCWLAAKQWEGREGDDMPPPPVEEALEPLEPPRPVFQGDDGFMANPLAGGYGTPSPPLSGPQIALRPRTNSPARNRASQAWRSSIALGLEPVPMAPSYGSSNRSSSISARPMSNYIGARSASMNNLSLLGSPDYTPDTPPPEAATSGTTFDDILGGPEEKKTTKKKGRFF